MLVILMLSFGVAQAQFVAIKLEVPAGSTFKSQVVDPMQGGGSWQTSEASSWETSEASSWETSKAITWIEIKVPENLAFLLDIQYPERSVEPLLESFFLNNGTSNFKESVSLKSGSQAVLMNKSGKVIRNMNPRPLSLSAWLGLPMTRGIAIKIEYP
jgi:hypothetical protein